MLLSGFWLNASLCLQAASITWKTPAIIANDADIFTNGSLVFSCDGSGATATVNTVTFAGSFSGNVTLTSSAGSVSGSFVGGTNAPWSGLTTNYQTVLAGGIYANNNTSMMVTLNNLKAGSNYLVQLWVNDSRSGTMATPCSPTIITNAVECIWKHPIPFWTFTTAPF